jgi:hypothetical protein
MESCGKTLATATESRAAFFLTSEPLQSNGDLAKATTRAASGICGQPSRNSARWWLLAGSNSSRMALHGSHRRLLDASHRAESEPSEPFCGNDCRANVLLSCRGGQPHCFRLNLAAVVDRFVPDRNCIHSQNSRRISQCNALFARGAENSLIRLPLFSDVFVPKVGLRADELLH